jgi:hypothetical protein
MQILCRLTFLLCALSLSAAASAQGCPEKKTAPQTGTGSATAPDCSQMSGNFRNGMLHGQGKISRPDGMVEQGEFMRGRLWGKGTVTYSDGRIAEGEFVEGRLSGQGKLTWPDGRMHEGMFYRGRAAGPGRYRNEKGEISEGMFDGRGQLNGRGIRTLPDGTKTYGEFRDNNPVGIVTVVKPDGSEEQRSIDVATASQAGSTRPAGAGDAAPGGAAQTIQEIDRAVRSLRGIFGK